jgi:hypothetical protein
MVMAAEFLLENPKTGAVKPFRTGFDWILFLFSGVLGIPLFLQGLPIWGGVFVLLWLADFALIHFAPKSFSFGAQAAVAAVFFALQLWLGFYGRGQIVKAHVARGWRKRERAPKPRQARKRRP